MMITGSSNKWRLTKGLERSFPFFTTTRKIIDNSKICKAKFSVLNSKKANLSAAKKERIQLPITDDGYRISEFLRHPIGIRAMLNTNALQNFETLDTNTYICYLPKLELLKFEAAPVLELRVTPSEEDCVVEMLSSFMTNRVTWNTSVLEPFLEADMKLDVTLEIYTVPFSLLPKSAVEGPGNLMMQALVDRLITLFLEQLLQDYGKWANLQSENLEFSS